MLRASVAAGRLTKALRCLHSTPLRSRASTPRRAAGMATHALDTQSAAPPATGKVKLALCQMLVTADKDANIQRAVENIEECAAAGSHIVVLPEMWNCPYSNDSFPTYAEDVASGASQSVGAIVEAAKRCGVLVVGGSVPERVGDKLYNTCCVVDVDGTILAKHRKTHLFDINIPGKISFQESKTLTAGEALTCVRTRYGVLGVGICYDLRFPEMAMIYRERGAQLLVFPGAFNMTTGPVHWALLQQARALDNQLFVCSCSPARSEDGPYTAWGHSLCVGPFGEVRGELGHEEGVLYEEIDLSEMEGRREAMPLTQQKRSDLYKLEDLQSAASGA